MQNKNEGIEIFGDEKVWPLKGSQLIVEPDVSIKLKKLGEQLKDELAAGFLVVRTHFIFDSTWAFRTATNGVVQRLGENKKKTEPNIPKQQLGKDASFRFIHPRNWNNNMRKKKWVRNRKPSQLTVHFEFGWLASQKCSKRLLHYFRADVRCVRFLCMLFARSLYCDVCSAHPTTMRVKTNRKDA